MNNHFNFINTKCIEVVSDSDDFLQKIEKIDVNKRSKSTGEISKKSHKIKRNNSHNKSPKTLKSLKFSNEINHQKYNFITSKEVSQQIRDPLLLIIDVRPFGLLSTASGATYNANHIRLSINIPVEGKSDDQIIEEIEGDQFLFPMLSFSIQMQYKIVIYDQNCSEESSPSFQFYSILQRFAMKLTCSESSIFLLSGGFSDFEKQYGNLCGNTKDLRSPLNNFNFETFEENIIDLIHPRIFLGRQLSDDEVDLLRKNNIQHVLSISNAQDRLPEDIKLLFIQLEDTSDSDLFSILDEACDFIENALTSNNGNIYIHCSRGLSRSPTILIGYLMRKFNLSARESFELVKKSRPAIGPQCNFIRQLLIMEKEMTRDADAYVPSIPLQIYVLHETRCEDYYRSLEFLTREKKKEKIDIYTSTLNFLKRKLLVDR